jgi:LacI family transcriptional regulator
LKKVTIYDVAAMSGVSAPSVSWVLSGHPRSREISEAVREKIKNAANKLGYRRNISAATMRKGVNESTIGLLPGNCDNELLYMTISEINANGLGVRIYNNADIRETIKDLEDNQINRLLSFNGRVSVDPMLLKYVSENNIKMIMVGGEPIPGFITVRTDERLAMHQAVEYLYNLGHRNICLHCGPHCYFSTKERHNGFLQALRDFGLDDSPTNVLCETVSASSLFRFLHEKTPSALCSISPVQTINIEMLLMKSGLRVPEDISLLSFGNRGKIASNFSFVPLTALTEQTEQIVHCAVHTLLGLPDAVQETTLFHTSLTLAESCMPPRADYARIIKCAEPRDKWLIVPPESYNSSI